MNRDDWIEVFSVAMLAIALLLAVAVIVILWRG